jgi:hypothetical protein
MDNPANAVSSSACPSMGGAYFDVLNFHYYPLYTPGNSDAAADGMFTLKSQFAVAAWARATTGEAATAMYALAASGPVTAHAWDYSATATTSTVAPTGGSAALNLTSAPQFFDVP